MMTIRRSSAGALSGAFLAGGALQCLSLAIVFWALMATGAFAQTPTPDMPPMSPELAVRLKKLETELRCLVCQNQTLAESPAGLAGDLRREIRLLADSGKSDEEIKQHLKERYGDFVLYKPPVESRTWLLWFGPFVLLFGGALLVGIINRRTPRSVAPSAVNSLSESERARASKLLED